MFLGVVGIALYLHKPEKRFFILSASEIDLKKIVLYIVPFVFVSFISIVLNDSFDFYYPRYALSLILCFFGTYLLAYLFYSTYGQMSPQKVIDYFVITNCVFLFIGLLAFFQPDIQSFLTSVQRHNESAINSIERTQGARLISIGATFFTAAVINGFVLLLIGLHFYCFKMSVEKKVLYVVAFIYITVVGMMMGRSTMIGGVIGLILISLSFSHDFSKTLKSLVATFISVSLVCFIYFGLASLISLNFEDLYKFGFEMFINYQNGDGFSAHSNEKLWMMYNTLPDDFATWLIGDAKWNEGDHYYMRVDPGYLRSLWYFGIVGLIALLWYFFRMICYVVVEKNVFEKKMIPFMALSSYLLILYSKGPLDLYFYLLPFAFCDKKLLSQIQISKKIS